MIDRRRCPSAMPTLASNQHPLSSGPRCWIAPVISPRTPVDDSLSPRECQKPAIPHISRGDESYVVEGSIPFDELPDSVPNRGARRKTRGLDKVPSIGERRGNVAGLHGKEIPFRFLPEGLFQKRNHLKQLDGLLVADIEDAIWRKAGIRNRALTRPLGVRLGDDVHDADDRLHNVVN